MYIKIGEFKKCVCMNVCQKKKKNKQYFAEFYNLLFYSLLKRNC